MRKTSGSPNKVEHVAQEYWAVSLACRMPWRHGKGWLTIHVIEHLRNVALFQHPHGHNLNRLGGHLLEKFIADEDDPINQTQYDGPSEVIPLHRDVHHPLALIEQIHSVDNIGDLPGLTFTMKIESKRTH